jgi:hypothetical protein
MIAGRVRATSASSSAASGSDSGAGPLSEPEGAGGEVAVEVDAARVVLSARGQAVGVDGGHDAHRAAGRPRDEDGAEAAAQLDRAGLVAVDATEDEETPGLVRPVREQLDGPALDGVAEDQRAGRGATRLRICASDSAAMALDQKSARAT